MIKYRRWVALLLSGVMTLSSATVLAAAETQPEPEASVAAAALEALEDLSPAEHIGQLVAKLNLQAQTEEAEPAPEAGNVAEAGAEPAPAAEDEGVKLIFNGERLNLAVPPLAQNGCTYVPLRAFTEALGCTVKWSPSGLATITRGAELTLQVQTGSSLICANDRYFYMPDACREIDGRLMAPIRGLAKVFSLAIAWDETAQTVTMTGGQALEAAKTFYNEKDLLWLSRIIFSESRGEPLEGKIAVGNVVINRTKAAQFPDTIYDVIFQRNQFTPAKTGAIYNTPSEDCVLAAKLCLEGYTEVDDALYFLNIGKSSSRWIVKNRTLVTKIGSHSFFS